MKYRKINFEDDELYVNEDGIFNFIYPMEPASFDEDVPTRYVMIIDKNKMECTIYWEAGLPTLTLTYNVEDSTISVVGDANGFMYRSILYKNNISVVPSFKSNISSDWVENLSEYVWSTTGINLEENPINITIDMSDSNIELYTSYTIINSSVETDIYATVTGQLLEGNTLYNRFGNIVKGSLKAKNSPVKAINTRIIPNNNGTVDLDMRFAMAGYYPSGTLLQINNLGLADKIGLTADKLKSGESILDITGNYAGSGGYILQDGMRFGSSNRVFNNGVDWDTSNVTTMDSLFSGCPLLLYVDVSNWDTSNVKSMSKTFYGCSRVTNLNVSNWDTSNLLETVGMFYSCSNLDTIDVSNWNTSKIGTTSNMFDFCIKLNNITVNTWNVANIQTMNRMFNSCRSLTEINLSEWNTHKVTDMSYMFHNCVNLVNISFTNWNTINMLNMENMFLNCNNLSSETYSNIINMLPDANQLTNKYVTKLGINESKLNLRQKDDLTIKGYTVESITPSEPILDL